MNRHVTFMANVLVHAIDATHPHEKDIAREIVGSAVAIDSAIVGFQVVQETLQIITRKARVIASEADAEAVLVPLRKVHPSADLSRRALEVQAKQGFPFYDSLNVAAALEAGCRRPITEDLHHGRRIGGLRIENPFRS